MTGGLAAADARGPAAAALGEALARRHQATSPGSRVAAPAVVTLGAYNVFGDRADAEAALRAGARVHLASSLVVIGPSAGRSADQPCGHCLARRWQRLRPEPEREALEWHGGSRAVGRWPALTERIADAVWQLYLASTAPGDPPGGGAWVWAMSLDTLSVRRFPLVADPLCPSCGPSEGEPRFTTLPSAPKLSPEQYRQRDVRDFDLPVAALVNPVCGVLGGSVHQTVTSPTTAPVVGEVMIHGYRGMAEMTWSGQANSFELSRSLAFFEGLERYAGITRRHRGEPVVASYLQVGDAAIDPRQCGLYPAITYELDPACTPFDPDEPIAWVWGTRVGSGEPVLVPKQLAYYGNQQDEPHFVFGCSNGCATGASLPEAILSGVLELVERDSFLLGWYGGAALTRLEIDRAADIELSLMLRRAELQGYDVHVFDNRIDLHIPAVTGVAVRRDGGPGLLSFAAAASLDPYTAVRGAVSEILTYLPELPRRLAGRVDDARAMLDDYLLVRHLRDHPTLYSLPEAAKLAERYLDDGPAVPMADAFAAYQEIRPRTADLMDDVSFVSAELARAGLEIIVVEQTAAEQRQLGLHTIAAIVPGLLPIDFGWSRQRALHMPRMFTAFRRAGLRDRDLTPADLHYAPHPFP
jgi:ribosomal protein S12 methylthiotransferase accessory factor